MKSLISNKLVFQASAVLPSESIPIKVKISCKNNSFLNNLFKSLHLGSCICCNEQKVQVTRDLEDGCMSMQDFYKYGRKNYKQCLCKENITFQQREDTKYILIYANGDESTVGKNIFNKVNGKVILQKDLTIKYVYPAKKVTTRHNIRKLKVKSNKQIHLQGFNEVLMRTKRLVSDLRQSCSSVSGSVSASYMSILGVVDSIKSTCEKIPMFRRYVLMIRDIFTPLVSIFGLVHSLSLVNLTAIVGNVLTIFKIIDEFDKSNTEDHIKKDLLHDLESLCPTEDSNKEDVFYEANSHNLDSPVKFQTLEGLFGAAAIQILPKWIQRTLSSFTQLSSTKLLDDNLIMAKFFRTINIILFSVLGLLVKRDVVSESSYNKIEEFLDGTCIGKYTYYVLRMEQSVGKVVKDGQIVNDMKYQDEVLNLNAEIEEDKIEHGTFIERNGAIRLIIDQFKAVVKLIKSNKDITRVEPICIIFEGKPKTGKSVTMANLTTCLLQGGKSVYSHTTPNPKIAKDFYDDYNNQDIFIMDDVGQQGNSQWCQIINLVSPIKYGLPCANATLKQTKYMSSSVLLGTTNKLENLVFRKDDGVSEPDALFRRCDILNFNDISMVSNESGFLRPTGQIIYKHFQMGENNGTGGYVDGFEPNFAKYAPHLKPYFDYNGCDTNDQLRWILEILSHRVQFKRNEKKVQILDMDKILKGITFQYLQIQDIVTPLEILNKYFNMTNLDMAVSFSAMLVSSLFTTCTGAIDSTLKFFRDNFSVIIMVLLGSGLSFGLLKFFGCKTDKDITPLTKIKLESAIEQAISMYEPVNEVTTSETAIKKNMRYVKIIVDMPSGERTCQFACSLLSGGTMVTNYHMIMQTMDKYELQELRGRIFAIVYSDWDKKMIMYDNVMINPIMTSISEDIILWTLPTHIPSLLPDISHLLEVEESIGSKFKLITPSGFVDLSKQIKKRNYAITIQMNTEKLLLDNTNSCQYEFSVDGACGSVVTNYRGKVIGFHIAGGKDIGYARLWDISTIKKLQESMRKVKNIRYAINMQDDNGREGCSVVKCENVNKWSGTVPKSTKIVPSEISGVFPLTRLPVNLKQPNIIKEVSKKSYKAVAEVDVDALNFAKSYLQSILPRYEKVSEREVVIGTEETSRIDKKTSSGFGFPLSKENYLDYEKGCYSPEFARIVADIKKQVLEGCIDPAHIVYVETLKDELRDAHKKDKPRCFKMSPLGLTCIGREFFMNLMEDVKKDRYSNGIMIGINPFEEWGKLYSIAAKFDNNCNDGDYGEWDGSMMTQFQTMVAEVMESKFDGEENDLKVLNFYLTTLISCVTINMNELLVTTHSMPSGCMLTAFFNCLINKAYGAYIYYRLMKKENVRPSVEHFILNYFSCVYGDDILMFVKNDIKHILNGVSYKSECEKLGLKFTTADKISDMVEFKKIEDCQFLKRSFRFDTLLGYTCPLDTGTMEGTINFVSQSGRNNELTQIKIWNFQREALLHGIEYYTEAVRSLKEYVLDKDLNFVFLERDYIVDLYRFNKEAFIEGLILDTQIKI